MRRVFGWLLGGVTVVALVLGAGWGAYGWWQSQPEQLQAAAAEAFRQAEAAQKAGDPASAVRGYMVAEDRFVAYFKDGPKPPPTEILILRYKTLSNAANLLGSEEAAREVAPGRKPAAILGVARQCAAQAAQTDPSYVPAQAAMLECCFRDDQLDLAERYARNFLKHITNDEAADPVYHPHLMGAHFVCARSALRRTPPQADLALEHLKAADELQEAWLRQQFGDKPLAPSVRYRWRLTNLEAQAFALKAAPPRLITGSRAASNAQAAAQELQAKIAAWLQRVRDEIKLASDPANSTLAKLSSSDLRGLLEFLTFGVEQANTRAAALERVELMLVAWEALAGPKPSKLAQQELINRLGPLPRFIDKLPPDVRPAPRDWIAIYPRWEAVATRLIETNAALEPAAYLELTRSAHKNGHLEAGVGIARAGVRAAEARKLAADNKDVLELHGEAAWMSLLRGKPADAEEHLVALRRQTKQLRGLTTFVDSVTDLEEGQLDAATAKLQQVRQYPEYTRSLYPHLGLARALLDAGRFDQAAANLDRLEQYYQRYENLPEEQQILARRLGLHRGGLYRELFRTHLALNNSDQAAHYKDLLREDPDWLGVSVALVGHLLRLAPTAGVRSQESGAREEDLARLNTAKAELTAARRYAPEDVRLLLLEAEVTAARGGSTAGAEADALVQRALNGMEDRPDVQVAGVVWVLRRGRLDEAGAALARLERAVGSDTRSSPDRLAVLRARWNLARAQSGREADRLLNESGLGRERSFVDLYLAFPDGAGALLSKPEVAGLKHYRSALLDHARGNLDSAARSYLKAVAFATFRPEARRDLLACLLQLNQQDSPSAANALIVELLQSRADEPALLLAFVETAVLLDNVHGSQGAEGALEGLDAMLRERYQDSVSGSCLQARTWLAAGRPDRALKNAEHALESAPTHLPALQLAVTAARTNRDWAACLRHVQAWEKLQPGWADVMAARAEALAGLGETTKATAAYEELLTRHPDRPEGYLGPATLLEQGGDFTAALGWVTRRRERTPADLTTLQAEVRLRARLGQLVQADAAGQEAVRTAKPDATADAALAVARGLLEGGSANRAQTWARQAETAAEKAHTLQQLARARCLLGDVAQALAQEAASPEDRKKLMGEAVNHYRTAYRDVPGMPEAGRPLALLLARERGEAEAALAIVQRLRQGRYSQTGVGGDRMSLDLLDTVGVVYRASGQHREAVTLFREASTRYPEEPVVFLHLGRALAALKRKPEATEALERAAQLASNRATRVRDVNEKARWLELADEAQQPR